MKIAIVVCALLACAYSASIVPASTTLVHTPQFDSAVIQSDRLGGNFAYSTLEAKAYAAVSPVVQNVPTPVAVSYHATPVQVPAVAYQPAYLQAAPAFVPAAPAYVPAAPAYVPAAPAYVPAAPAFVPAAPAYVPAAPAFVGAPVVSAPVAPVAAAPAEAAAPVAPAAESPVPAASSDDSVTIEAA